MALFGRGKATRNSSDHDETTVEDAVVEEETTSAEDEADDVAEETSEEREAARRRRSRLRPRDEIDLSNGPYDRADMPDGDVLDFGAMSIGATSDVELRLDVDEQNQVITGMTAVMGEDESAAVQLQAFAAPKTTGIWYGIRREIAEAVVASGGSAEEVDGPLGTELHARMPHVGEDGRTTFSPARFVGVDGPRWFLRAVLSGEAAVDPEMGERALELVRSVGVRRGNEPRAPRELLELTIPSELMEQADEPAADSQTTLGRLERGPEIAETR